MTKNCLCENNKYCPHYESDFDKFCKANPITCCRSCFVLINGTRHCAPNSDCQCGHFQEMLDEIQEDTTSMEEKLEALEKLETCLK